MKVVHLNCSDKNGGAAIAAVRHCEAMIRAGIDSKLLVLKKEGRKSFTVAPFILFWKIAIAVFGKISFLQSQRLHSWGGFSRMMLGMPFWRAKELVDADIIVLHWVNGNMLSVRGIEHILKLNKPTYWYMHDMFPITGGCHNSFGCEGYSAKCQNCLVLGNRKSLPARRLKCKFHRWNKYSNLSFITPSRWLAECAENSIITAGHSVKVFPNVINTQLFQRLSFSTKSLFGLDSNKRTILFCAAKDSVYKGWKYVTEVLSLLDSDKYEGLVIGEIGALNNIDHSIKVISTGYLSDEISMVIAYNACDVLLITSVAENYPNVVLEAMACGIPCVGFPTGGIPDLINHGTTGYLTSERSSKSLLEGIEFVFENNSIYESLSSAARNQIEINNSFEKNMSQIF